MKRANNLYPILISDGNLKQAILKVNKTHKWRPHHRPNKVMLWIESDIQQRVIDLRNIIKGGFVPAPATMKHRWDKSAGKWRDIHEPRLWPGQYIHHALVQVLQPVMMRGMDNWCCGSIQGRGIHYGHNAIRKWMKNDVKGTKYCAELDIHHFYDSLEPEVVFERMKHLNANSPASTGRLNGTSKSHIRWRLDYYLASDSFGIVAAGTYMRCSSSQRHSEN